VSCAGKDPAHHRELLNQDTAVGKVGKIASDGSLRRGLKKMRRALSLGKGEEENREIGEEKKSHQTRRKSYQKSSRN